MTRWLTAIGWALLLALGPAWSAGPDLSAFRTLAIQHRGRLKPVDTFAAESVRLLTGKERFQGRDPLWQVLLWMADPQEALAEANLQIRNLALKEALGLEAERRWFSFAELQQNPRLKAFHRQVREHRSRGEKLPPLLDEAEMVLARMALLQGILGGEVWTIVPHPTERDGAWTSPVEASPRQGYPEEQVAALREAFAGLIQAVREGEGVARRSRELRAVLQGMGPYPSASALQREVHYNRLHPFRKAWILYLAGVVLLLGAGLSQGTLLDRAGLLCIVLGFAIHAYGFTLRCAIAGRPPVTNMYESVVWVTFGAVLFALLFEFKERSRAFLLAAASVAVIGLVLADNLPAVLDPSINPLTPVLRDNFWLTVHVLTITLGYAAFLLGLGLAHMVLFKQLFRPREKEQIARLNRSLYRSLQVGVLLLAAGTILGGVWANYSWGRFWGWDPKEVWALIALLGYLALLHGRYAGWLDGFGIAAGSILAFQGVLMAWYGVNFVLGAGLHSYGFGKGGVGYVGMYVLAELVLVGLAVARRRALRRS